VKVKKGEWIIQRVPKIGLIKHATWLPDSNPHVGVALAQTKITELFLSRRKTEKTIGIPWTYAYSEEGSTIYLDPPPKEAGTVEVVYYPPLEVC